MLEELGGDVFIDWIVKGQLKGDAHEIQRIHRHPACAVGLIDEAAGGQRLAAIEDADIVEAKEAPLKQIAPLSVLAVDPPGEIEHQLVEGALQERQVARIAAALP